MQPAKEVWFGSAVLCGLLPATTRGLHCLVAWLVQQVVWQLLWQCGSFNGSVAAPLEAGRSLADHVGRCNCFACFFFLASQVSCSTTAPYRRGAPHRNSSLRHCLVGLLAKVACFAAANCRQLPPLAGGAQNPPYPVQLHQLTSAACPTALSPTAAPSCSHGVPIRRWCSSPQRPAWPRR